MGGFHTLTTQKQQDLVADGMWVARKRKGTSLRPSLWFVHPVQARPCGVGVHSDCELPDSREDLGPARL